MGEIIGLGILVLIVLIGLVGLISWNRSSGRQRRALLNAPAVIMPPGEQPDLLLANAVKNYQLAQRAARLLDRISELPATSTVSERDRQEAQSIVKAFYGN